MNYLTQYYKNQCKILTEEINILQKNLNEWNNTEFILPYYNARNVQSMGDEPVDVDIDEFDVEDMDGDGVPGSALDQETDVGDDSSPEDESLLERIFQDFILTTLGTMRTYPEGSPLPPRTKANILRMLKNIPKREIIDILRILKILALLLSRAIPVVVAVALLIKVGMTIKQAYDLINAANNESVMTQDEIDDYELGPRGDPIPPIPRGGPRGLYM